MTPLGILSEAVVRLLNQGEGDINEWIQAMAILEKIRLRIAGEPFEGGSSVEIWWQEQDQNGECK